MSKQITVNDLIGKIDAVPARTEAKKEEVKKPVDGKSELIKEAQKLGLGAKSTLDRLSVPTLKKRIEEAKNETV